MQDLADKQTIDLFHPVNRGRGRPFTGKAMTNAERQRRYRQNLKAKNHNVTKNQGQGEGVGVHYAVDHEDAGDVLLTRLAHLEQQVADLFDRELRALREVARLQALIASTMPEQLNQIELRQFDPSDLPDQCQRYEK